MQHDSHTESDGGNTVHFPDRRTRAIATALNNGGMSQVRNVTPEAFPTTVHAAQSNKYDREITIAKCNADTARQQLEIEAAKTAHQRELETLSFHAAEEEKQHLRALEMKRLTEAEAARVREEAARVREEAARVREHEMRGSAMDKTTLAGEDRESVLTPEEEEKDTATVRIHTDHASGATSHPVKRARKKTHGEHVLYACLYVKPYTNSSLSWGLVNHICSSEGEDRASAESVVKRFKTRDSIVEAYCQRQIPISVARDAVLFPPATAVPEDADQSPRVVGGANVDMPAVIEI